MQPLDYQDGETSRSTPGVSKMLWCGLAVLTFGVGPLVAIILAASLGLTRDPNPNPIGPGLLAFVSFWPGVGLTVAGAIVTLRRRIASRAS